MNEDLLRRLNDLHETAANLSAQLSWAVRGTQSGVDKSGAVSLTLNTGNAIVRFALRSDWRQQPGFSGLGAAIKEAFTNATMATMEAFACRANQLAEGGDIPDAHSLPTPMAELPTSTLEHGEAFARRLYQAIDEAEKRMDEFQHLVAAQASKHHRIASPAGVVHVVVSNSVLAAVEINQQWLREAADAAIEKELGAVLRSGFPGISQQVRQTVAAVPPVGVVLAAASRPADLLRQLGLTS